MSAPSPINFERLLNRKWGNILLPLFALLNLLAIFFLRSWLALDLAMMLWLSVVPGVLTIFLLLSLFNSRISWVELASLGGALGLGITPVVFSALRVYSVSDETVLVVSILNFLLAGVDYFLNARAEEAVGPYDLRKYWRVVWGSILFVTLFLQAYNFQNIYFNYRGDLVTRGLFGIDLPYLVGQFASLKSWPELRDLHQVALPMSYHDFAYIFIVATDQFSRHELFELLLYVHPIFSYTLFALSGYALAYRITAKHLIALSVVAGLFLLGSFLGTDQGSSALSPSFVWGNILLMNALLVVAMLLKSDAEVRSAMLYIVLAALLTILSRSKITTFAALEVVLGFLVVALIWQRRFRVAAGIAASLLVAGLVLVLSQGSSPYMPARDFLIGAPLLGYANHLASILHVTAASISPVSSGLNLALRQLTILPYFAFHLARFVFMDGRLLVLFIVLVLFRKRSATLAFGGNDPLLFWLMVSLIPIGFLFPIAYSPAWYPLAFSFYTPLIGVEMATILSMILLAQILLTHELRSRKILLPILGLLVLGSFVGNVRSIAREDASRASTVNADFIAALRYLRDHSDPHDVIASRRYHLVDSARDESFFLYSAFSERPVISEGASYGVLLGAVATIDTLKGLHRVQIAMDTLSAHRAALDSIYFSRDSLTVVGALKRYNARYILEDKEIHQHLLINPMRIATPFFDNTAITIWKVRS